MRPSSGSKIECTERLHNILVLHVAELLEIMYRIQLSTDSYTYLYNLELLKFLNFISKFIIASAETYPLPILYTDELPVVLLHSRLIY